MHTKTESVSHRLEGAQRVRNLVMQAAQIFNTRNPVYSFRPWTIWIVAALFIYSFLPQSAPLHILDIRARWWVGVAVAMLIPLVLARPRISVVCALLGAGALSSALTLSVWWGDVRFLSYSLPFVVAAALADKVGEAELRAFAGFCTFVLAVVVALAWVAFFVIYMGGDPLTTFPFPGREGVIYMLPGSFTNSLQNQFSRPSGIFDEPGALSFYLCAVASLRHYLSMDKRATWGLLAAGFVTTSLAHAIYVVVHAFAEIVGAKRRLSICAIILVSLVLIVPLFYATPFGKEIASRLDVSGTEERVIAGDNRTPRMLNAVDALRAGGVEGLAVGLGPRCSYEWEPCVDAFGKTNLNPLRPLVQWGLVGAWPYYVFVICAFVAALTSPTRALPIAGLALLFLQRPYVLKIGYTALGALILVLLLKDAGVFKFDKIGRRRSA